MTEQHCNVRVSVSSDISDLFWSRHGGFVLREVGLRTGKKRSNLFRWSRSGSVPLKHGHTHKLVHSWYQDRGPR